MPRSTWRSRRASLLAMAPRISVRRCRRDHSIARTIQSHAAGVSGDKLSARAFEREAMLVIPPRRVRPQRRDSHSIFDFGCLRKPLLRRAVRLRWQPPLDVPAILGKIFRDAPQLHRFANGISVRVTVRPPPADPRQPRPAPHHAKVRLAITVYPACARSPFLHASRRLMRFSCDSNQGTETRCLLCSCNRREQNIGRCVRRRVAEWV
jgi:hypothetical protein